VSTSEDGTGCLLVHDITKKEITSPYKITTHTAGVTSVSIHPINTIGLFSSRDGSVSVHDLFEGKLLLHYPLEDRVPITYINTFFCHSLELLKFILMVKSLFLLATTVRSEFGVLLTTKLRELCKLTRYLIKDLHSKTLGCH